MNIEFTYKKSLKLSEQEIDFLSKESHEFGQVEIKKYTSRFGALDLLSIVETCLTFIVLTNLQAFTKGFIREDWFKSLGERIRRDLENEIKQAKGFIKAHYSVFVKNNPNKQEAFVISEAIGETTLYVVINHFYMTDELLERLPQALVNTYGKISMGHLIIESKICQLFPDFENNEWRYLFVPTYNGFGRYVDQYYDFKTNKLIRISSKREFQEIFSLIDQDKYKLIINPNIRTAFTENSDAISGGSKE